MEIGATFDFIYTDFAKAFDSVAHDDQRWFIEVD